MLGPGVQGEVDGTTLSSLLPLLYSRLLVPGLHPSPAGEGATAANRCALVRPPLRGKWSCPLSFAPVLALSVLYFRGRVHFVPLVLYIKTGAVSLGAVAPALLIPLPLFGGLGVTNLLLPSLPAFFMGVCPTSPGLGPYFGGLPFPPCQGDLSSPCEWEKAYVLKASGWVNKSCTCRPAVFIVETLIMGERSLCILRVG